MNWVINVILLLQVVLSVLSIWFVFRSAALGDPRSWAQGPAAVGDADAWVSEGCRVRNTRRGEVASWFSSQRVHTNISWVRLPLRLLEWIPGLLRPYYEGNGNCTLGPYLTSLYPSFNGKVRVVTRLRAGRSMVRFPLGTRDFSLLDV